MNFNPSKIAENFILNKLKSIKGGSLNLKNYNQEIKFFGEPNCIVKADIVVHNPKFYLNILKHFYVRTNNRPKEKTFFNQSH